MLTHTVGAGIQMGNAAIAAYIIDCYPLQSMSIVTFYSVMLNLSAFINPFFIFPYVTNVGYTWTFASQGIITLFFCVPVLAAIHYFGSRIRAKNGVPNWVNPECDVTYPTHIGQDV
jgi:MFS family permease